MSAKVLSNGIDLNEAVNILSTLPYKNGEYSSRYWGHPFHFLISYPSKLKPSIAYFLVKLFTKASEKVLDPFSGVGTIPFEACSQGRVGIGSDISPVAYHATRAKLDPPSPRELREQLTLLDDYIKSSRETVAEDVEEELIPFYHPETLREILAAKRFFSDYANLMNLSFLFACMLHILHGNRPYALSRRSHNIMPWPPKGEFIYKPVMRSLTEKALRMISVGLPKQFIRGMTLQDNVCSLSLDKESVDCIITSPPFYGNRDFLRMNRIRLWFCGWNYKKQDIMKSVFLEHQKDIGGYENVFREFNRVLKPGRLCIMHLGVVGNFDMARNLSPFAKKAGFAEIATIYEDTSKLESHGIVDRGATRKHQFLILRKLESQNPVWTQ
jgi:SAM-dependent methyltransferase